MNELYRGTVDAQAASGWRAQMVRPDTDMGVGERASFVRKTFRCAEPDAAATLRISALGLYRCFINGVRVGADLLTPGWTSYWDRLSFQTYPVDELLKPGDNLIEIWLGDGWYRSPILWADSQIVNCWGEEVAAIAEIRSAHGGLIAATDGTWSSGLLPILKSGIYFGEIYDARLEQRDATGRVSVLGEFDHARLMAHEAPAVHELEPFGAIRSFVDTDGRTVYDFGQNAAGYVAFTVAGERGARVVVEHAEVLDHLGQFDRSSMRSAEARLEYTLKGDAIEDYRPVFTYQGFRYASVAIEGRAELKSIELVPITSLGRPTASFTSANPLLDRVVQNTIWSQRSNFIEVPTDCPQRDERLGWTGDAQIFAATACYLHDSHAFLRKWLRDVVADQRPGGEIANVVPDPSRNHEDQLAGYYGSTGWGDAICVVPWVLWQHYGDREILVETLPAMLRWNDFVWSISDGPIVRPPRHRSRPGFTFGDWLQPKGRSEKPLPTIGDDAAATIYLYISSTLTAKAARIAGDPAAALRMEERAATVKRAFAREFITASGRLVNDDQTSYALAILHDLIPAELLPAAADYFRQTIERADGRIGTGFIGTPALLPALTRIGEFDLAGDLLLQEGLPGWLYQVKSGATTIWERWDAIGEDGRAFDPAMNSFNHYAYGAVCQWLFESVAGFRPDDDRPGFKEIVFEPVIIPLLSPVAAHHNSPAGRIEAGWSVAGDRVSYEISIPPGASGRLLLQPGYVDATLDGHPVGNLPIALASGPHLIRFRLSEGRGTTGRDSVHRRKQ